MPHIRLKLKQNKLSDVWVIKSLNNLKTAGSLIKWGFPFCVLAKCLQFFEISCVYKAFQNIL